MELQKKGYCIQWTDCNGKHFENHSPDEQTMLDNVKFLKSIGCKYTVRPIYSVGCAYFN